MHMEEPKEKEMIIEERLELMVSHFVDEKPNLRTAHFLKPISSSIDEPPPKPFSLSHPLLPHTFEPAFWPLKICFNGWRNPRKSWRFWVDILRPRYQTVWEKAGIFEAIINSTCSIKRYHDLVLGLAEKWNPETNTFLFAWGETTFSLEDVMILGGYPVLGFPVTHPGETQELKEVEDKLVEECRKIRKGPARKTRETEWMKHFMGSGKDIEHEAFLSLWLARFVFLELDGTVKEKVFPIAYRLARGDVMALGPAVLASIYRDLTLLKETIVGLSKLNNDDDCVLSITLFSPMQLVQIWAWERFPKLQPEPNVIDDFEPRSARWSNVKIVKVENMRMVLDSTGENFVWRPYVKVVTGLQFHEFHKEKHEWISVSPSMNTTLLSFALCLRPSELVGFGTGCIQQYLPHRVAMQFGLDQDVPCHVARSNETPEIAWNNYIRPINDRKLYIPSRFFESKVTFRYLERWKKLSMVFQKDVIKGIVQRKRSSRKRSERVPWVKRKKRENNASVPPGFPLKLNKVKPEPFFVEDVKSEGFEVSNTKDNGGFLMELSTTRRQNAMHIKAKNRGSARVIGESNESEVEYDEDKVHRHVESNAISVYMIASRLEARVARLERIAADLKANRMSEGKRIKGNRTELGLEPIY